jgi:hypothetical protein
METACSSEKLISTYEYIQPNSPVEHPLVLSLYSVVACSRSIVCYSNVISYSSELMPTTMVQLT